MAWSANANLQKYRQEMKEPKMLTGSELRSARMLHSHPSWANRPSV
jgi:hypothetical protein